MAEFTAGAGTSDRGDKIDRDRGEPDHLKWDTRVPFAGARTARSFARAGRPRTAARAAPASSLTRDAGAEARAAGRAAEGRRRWPPPASRLAALKIASPRRVRRIIARRAAAPATWCRVFSRGVSRRRRHWPSSAWVETSLPKKTGEYGSGSRRTALQPSGFYDVAEVKLPYPPEDVPRDAT